MKKMKMIGLYIIVVFFATPVLGQLNKIVEPRESVSECQAKYFPKIFKLDTTAEEPLDILCDKPSILGCSISWGISHQNYEGIKCLVDAGYDFNVESGEFYTADIPIMNAAFFDIEILKMLFESDIPLNVNVVNKDGYNTLLYLTSRVNFKYLHGRASQRASREQSVEFLLKKGADPNIAFNGTTPLMFQAQGRVGGKYFELLLRNGANPNLQSQSGETALMMIDDNPEKIKLLLDYNADIYLKDLNGNAAIFHAIENCQQNKIKSLLEKDDKILESVNQKGTTAAKLLKAYSKSNKCKSLKKL